MKRLLACACALLSAGSVARAQTVSLAARASADSSFLERVRTPASDAAAAALHDSARIRLPALDSTFDLLMASGAADAALRFALAMGPVWTSNADYSRALTQYRRALAIPGAPSAVRAAALNQAALLAFRQRDQAVAAAFNREAIRIADQIGDKADASNGHVGLARVALRAGDYAAVQREAQIGLSIRQSAGDDARTLSSPMHLLAAGERLGGHLEEAARLYEFTLALAGLSGNRATVAGEMLNLGYVRLHQADTTSAERLFRESLSTFASMKSDDAVYLLGAMAALAAVRHQPVRAGTLYGAMDAELERLKITLDPDDQAEVDAFARLARSHTAADFDRARADGRKLSMPDAIALALRRS